MGVGEEEIMSDIEKYKGETREILNKKRKLEEAIQRADDKNFNTCIKTNVLLIIESSKFDDAIHNNSSPILVQNNPQAQVDLSHYFVMIQAYGLVITW